jgi:hypothetical protein
MSYLSGSWSAVSVNVDDHGCNVVLCVARHCNGHQLVGGLLRFHCRCQHDFEVAEGQDLEKTVTAKHESVAGLTRYSGVLAFDVSPNGWVTTSGVISGGFGPVAAETNPRKSRRAIRSLDVTMRSRLGGLPDVHGPVIVSGKHHPKSSPTAVSTSCCQPGSSSGWWSGARWRPTNSAAAACFWASPPLTASVSKHDAWMTRVRWSR